MFERYTERARRVLFFARYEASNLGSLSIETEHLLLGLIREGKGLSSRIFARSHLSLEAIRREIEGRTTFREKVSVSVEIPFSAEAKRVLGFAAEEADRLLHNYIGTEHLLLGILREERSVAASILLEKGMRLGRVRDDIVLLLNDKTVPKDDSEMPVAVTQPPPHSWPQYVPSRVVHITFSDYPPSQEAWIQHAGATWRALGFTLKHVVAHAWESHESLVDLNVPDIDDRTRYDFTIVLPPDDSLGIVPELLRESIQRDFGVVVTREDDPLPRLVVTAR
jgi:hypothetical protein